VAIQYWQTGGLCLNEELVLQLGAVRRSDRGDREREGGVVLFDMFIWTKREDNALAVTTHNHRSPSIYSPNQ